MPRSKKLDMGAIREREIVVEEIKRRFGEGAIQAARERLCEKCKEQYCFLLPITTDGKDCPYFPNGSHSK